MKIQREKKGEREREKDIQIDRQIERDIERADRSLRILTSSLNFKEKHDNGETRFSFKEKKNKMKENFVHYIDV